MSTGYPEVVGGFLHGMFSEALHMWSFCFLATGFAVSDIPRGLWGTQRQNLYSLIRMRNRKAHKA
jgi:hypothetical protein